MGKYLMVGICGFMAICICAVMACLDKTEIRETESGMLCDMYEGQTDGSVEVVIDEREVMNVLGKRMIKKEPSGMRVMEESTEAVEEVEAETVEAVEEVTEAVAEVIETVAEVVETVSVPTTVAVPETYIEVTAPPSDGFVIKAVNGAVLDGNLQRYLYDTLCARGIGWYYDISLCQLYQESRFDPNIIAYNGLDMGIAQIRSTYWGGLCAEAGLPNGNIFNPYDNIFIYTYLMARYLNAHGGDVNWGLSAYFTGNTAYSPEYIQQVMQWVGTVTNQ